MRMKISDYFKKKEKKFGLALGGGAALGAAHIGVMKALEEMELKPDMISGTSIGAFVAAHIAFGTPVETLEEIALDLDWLDISAFQLSKMGLLNNKKLGQKILDELGKVRIEDSPIPLSMIATNISTGEKVTLTEGPLYKAVMASTCLPGIFSPVEWNDMLLVDGFLCENIPISPLRDQGAERILAVDLTTNREYSTPEDLIDLLSNTFDIGLNNMIKQQNDEEEVEWIQPRLSAYNKSDTRQTRKLIDEGYQEAIQALKKKNDV